MATILTISEVANFAAKLHQQRKSIVVAGGCFDLLHIGHVTLLENAKKEGDVLIVLLESDEAIKKRKGIDRPIHSQKERAHLVNALVSVDAVIQLPANMKDKDYDMLMQDIHPDVIATTENDQSVSHKKRQADLVGAILALVNKYIPSVSTTKLADVLSKEL